MVVVGWDGAAGSIVMERFVLEMGGKFLFGVGMGASTLAVWFRRRGGGRVDLAASFIYLIYMAASSLCRCVFGFPTWSTAVVATRVLSLWQQ